MPPAAGPVLACALALVSAQANAQAGATPPPPAHQEVEPQRPAADVPTADDLCRTLEEAAHIGEARSKTRMFERPNGSSQRGQVFRCHPRQV
jgi:hypothetical protein